MILKILTFIKVRNLIWILGANIDLLQWTSWFNQISKRLKLWYSWVWISYKFMDQDYISLASPNISWYIS
jgi:hypothetical protein